MPIIGSTIKVRVQFPFSVPVANDVTIFANNKLYRTIMDTGATDTISFAGAVSADTLSIEAAVPVPFLTYGSNFLKVVLGYHEVADATTHLTAVATKMAFVSNDDIYQQIVNLLSSDSEILSRLDVETIIAQYCDKFFTATEFGNIVASYTALQSYPMKDLITFDQALAYFVASWMYTTVQKSSPSGELVKITTKTDSFQFSTSKSSNLTVEETFLARGLELLQQISAFASYFGIQNEPIVQLAGFRNSRKSSGFSGYDFNNIAEQQRVLGNLLPPTVFANVFPQYWK